MYSWYTNRDIHRDARRFHCEFDTGSDGISSYFMIPNESSFSSTNLLRTQETSLNQLRATQSSEPIPGSSYYTENPSVHAAYARVELKTKEDKRKPTMINTKHATERNTKGEYQNARTASVYKIISRSSDTNRRKKAMKTIELENSLNSSGDSPQTCEKELGDQSSYVLPDFLDGEHFYASIDDIMDETRSSSYANESITYMNCDVPVPCGTVDNSEEYADHTVHEVDNPNKNECRYEKMTGIRDRQ